MDFTQNRYAQLLQGFQKADYGFATFEAYCKEPPKGKFVVLRHDVDSKARNSLETARLEHGLGIKASYYFRVVKASNQPEIIKEISALGHEIGYHYEDMTICNGDVGKAIAHFGKWLDYFRQFYPVITACMHGSPRSRFDGRDLWKHYDYHDFGIIGEPYFDIDFSKVFYLTDTGRRWDGYGVSVRDKIPVFQEEWIKNGLVYHSTEEVLTALENGSFPKQLMLTTHPQRWTNRPLEWLQEFLLQSVKNVMKGIIVKRL